MTKRTKKWLFYSAVAVFLILSYIIILYAQGYKYSFAEGKFLRTGAISLKANTGAKVYLNDQLQGDTSFFNSAYSIDGLLPGSYKLTVLKDNHSVWQKNAIVEEGFVIDFPRVMLLPEQGEEEQQLFDEADLLFKNLKPVTTLAPSPTPRRNSPSPSPILIQDPFVLDLKLNKLYQNNNQVLEEIASNVKGFRVSENGNKLAWWNSNELWIIWLNDQNYQPFYKKGDQELITRFQIPIQNGTWFRDEDHLILELEQRDSKDRPYSIYRIIETDKRGGVNIIEL